MPQPVVRESLVDRLARQVSDDILAGRYAPGSLLPPERDLAAAYGVTRTSLKHTLVRLEQAGLIATRHGVGSVVQDYSATAGAALLPTLIEAGGEDLMHDVFEVRRLIGSVIARQAARNRQPAHTQELERLHVLLGIARSPADAQRIEMKIHRVLAEATGNRVFVLLTNTLLEGYRQVAPLMESSFADAEGLASELEPLIAAVGLGDAEAAEAAADLYLGETGSRLARAINTDVEERA